MDREEFLVPVAVWTGAPRHDISCMASPHPNTLVTGGHSGELCLWHHGTPRALVFSRQGLPCPVTVMESFTFRTIPLVAFGTADGSINVHHAVTGDALAAAPQILPDQFVATKIHVTKYREIDDYVLAFCLCVQDLPSTPFVSSPPNAEGSNELGGFVDQRSRIIEDSLSAVQSRVYVIQLRLVDSDKDQVMSVQFFDLYDPTSPKSGSSFNPMQLEPTALNSKKLLAAFPVRALPRIILSSTLLKVPNSLYSILLTLSTDMVIRGWVSKQVNMKEFVVYPRFELTVHLEQSKAESVVEIQSSPNSKLVVLVGSSFVHLFSIDFVRKDSNPEIPPSVQMDHVGDLQLARNAENKDEQIFIEGCCFVDDNHILIWSRSGVLELHKIQLDSSSFSSHLAGIFELEIESSPIARVVSPYHVNRIVSVSPISQDLFTIFLSASENINGEIFHWTASLRDIAENDESKPFVKKSIVSRIEKAFHSELKVGESYKAAQNEKQDSKNVTASCLFDTGSFGIMAVLGFTDGTLSCRILNDKFQNIPLAKHNSRITCVVGISKELVSKAAVEVLRAPVVITGSEDGQVKVFRMDSFVCIGDYYCHSRAIASFIHHKFDGPSGSRKQFEYITAISSDCSFSVYELDVQSVQIVESEQKAGAFEQHSDSEIDWLRSQSEDSQTLSDLKVEFRCNLIVVCSGHDSDVVAVLRNAWTILADYIISVTVSGLVYVWIASSGILSRVLSPKEGKKFLISRGLYAAKYQDSRTSQTHSSRESVTQIQSDSSELVSNLSVLRNEALPYLQKSVSEHAFGILKGITPDMNVQVFCLDIKQLSTHHCVSNPDLASPRSLVKSGNFIPHSSESISESKETSRPKSQEEAPSKGRINGALRHFESHSHINQKRSWSAESRKARSIDSDEAKGPSIAKHQRLILLHKELRISLSFLVDWNLGIDEGIEKDLGNMLALFNPWERLGAFSQNSGITFGILGTVPRIPKEQYTLTLLLPGNLRSCLSYSREASLSRWKFSGRFTALHVLALNTVCMSLMTSGSALQQSLFSRLVTYYTYLIGSNLPGFIDSSLLVLGFYGMHRCESIHLASRMLLQSVIERLHFDDRHRIFKYWSKFYLQIPKLNEKLIANSEFMSMISELLAGETKDGNDRKIVLSRDNDELFSSFDEFSMFTLVNVTLAEKQIISIFVLSFLILEYPEEFDSRFAKVLCTHLISLICDVDDVEPVRTSLAADILGKGIDFWKNYTSDIGKLIQSLIRLGNLRDNSGNFMLTAAVERTLVTTAQAAPKFFVAIIGNEALKQHSSAEERSSCIMKLVTVVRKHPESQLTVLPRIVETLTKCLDPAEPGIRRALIKPCTTALHALTKSYPMVSFHQQSQLFAVGTDQRQKSLIIIYDLRTSTRWRLLEGHNGDISAIAFSDDGSMLSSYSGNESPPTVRVWRTGSHGLISGLLGLQGKCLRTIHLREIELGSHSLGRILKNTKLFWTSPSDFRLTREDLSIMNFSV